MGGYGVATAAGSWLLGLAFSLFVSCVFTGAAVGTAWAGGLAARHAFGAIFVAAAVLAAAVSATGIIARLRYQ
jgi:hypothetical protein